LRRLRTRVRGTGSQEDTGRRLQPASDYVMPNFVEADIIGCFWRASRSPSRWYPVTASQHTRARIVKWRFAIVGKLVGKNGPPFLIMLHRFQRADKVAYFAGDHYTPPRLRGEGRSFDAGTAPLELASKGLGCAPRRAPGFPRPACERLRGEDDTARGKTRSLPGEGAFPHAQTRGEASSRPSRRGAGGAGLVRASFAPQRQPSLCILFGHFGGALPFEIVPDGPLTENRIGNDRQELRVQRVLAQMDRLLAELVPGEGAQVLQPLEDHEIAICVTACPLCNRVYCIGPGRGLCAQGVLVGHGPGRPPLSALCPAC
jgi:hypothetical protein